MCLAIPMKIVDIQGEFAVVSVGKVRRKVNVQLLPHIKRGEYIMVHAGFGIQKLDEKEAKKTLKIFK
ncbi:HypC/HybG/HupF family hydrogenase formation chaperone [Candidatus Omnitrophota bacterium]